MIHYDQEYLAWTMWALNYSSDKLDDVSSDIVMYSTSCPEWTYMDKDDGLTLFHVSYDALV
jgi:hypothetical protein